MLALAGFAVLFVTLSVVSFTRTSATADEPGHVTTAYASLAHGDYRVDPEHPPVLHLWDALPLLAMRDIRFDASVIDSVAPFTWATGRHHRLSNQFLYHDNDGDRLLYAARFMNVLLGVLLGIFLFSWAYEWLGFLAAVIALGFLVLEPNLVGNASLVTTDFGVAVFMFGTIYFLWRMHHDASRFNVSALAACFALAILSKFSAVLLAPMVAALLALIVWRGRLSWRRAVAVVGGLVAVTWIAIWAAYGFRYAPSATADWVYHFQDLTVVREDVPVIGRLVALVDDRQLLPNAFTQGFLLGQAKAQLRDSYLAGEISRSGWWYYFPVAFLIKTPVALVILFGTGIVIAAKRRDLSHAFVILPIAIYLAVVMTSHLNIGIRHLLPIFPFVILLATSAAMWLLSGTRSRRAVLALLVAFWMFESARVYPSPLAFFNVLVGGPDHGAEYLVDSNLDWGQDLKGLKRWMDEHQVSTINLAYFGSADPAYYGIVRRRLPAGPARASDLDPALLPGYVAVSATIASGLTGGPTIRELYAPLWSSRPVAIIGHSIRVYYVTKPWWN